MQKQYVTRVFLMLSPLLLLLSACDRQATGGRASITIQMPTAQQLNKMSKSGVSGFSALDYSKICFAVNVKGPGIATSPAKTCDIERGVFAGSVGVGETLSVTVEAGEDRKFELYAFVKNTTTEICPTVPPNGWNWPLTQIYFLGKTEGIKVAPPETLVEIAFSMPDSANNILAQNSWPDSCRNAANPAAKRTGRVVGASNLSVTANGYHVYTKISPLTDQKPLGTNYKIQNWKVGQ